MIMLAMMLALGGAPSGGSDASPTASDSLDFRLEDHRWTHRLLFVFAPSRDAASYVEQVKRLAGTQGGFRERDLLLIEVVNEGPSRVSTDTLTTASEAQLRNRFDVPPSAFRVVLVGKDGTEKRRDESPVPAQALFETIDAMPMRQREMREDDGGGSGL
jgi:hypothetical protein